MGLNQKCKFKSNSYLNKISAVVSGLYQVITQEVWSVHQFESDMQLYQPDYACTVTVWASYRSCVFMVVIS